MKATTQKYVNFAGLALIIGLFSIGILFPSTALAHPGHEHDEASIQISQKERVDLIKEANDKNAFILRATSRNSISAENNDFVKSAQERKDVMLKLLKKDPKAFVNTSIKKKEFDKLPQSIKEYIEKPISITGKLQVIHDDNVDESEGSGFRYFVTPKNGKGTKYELFLSRDLSIASDATVSITGVSIDNFIAAINAKGGDDNGVIVTSYAPSPDAIGAQRTLLIPVDYNNSPARPITASQLKNLVFGGSPFQNFYNEQSFGQTTFIGTSTEWTRLNRNADPDVCGYVTETDIGAIVSAQNINLNNYDRIVVLPLITYQYGGCSDVGKSARNINGNYYNISMSWVGLSYYDQPSFWGSQPFTWTNLDYVLSHELGHALGVMHANGLDCGTQAVGNLGTCTHREYGNSFDTMGSNSYSLHFNSFYKEYLGWVSPAHQLSITQSGTYTVNALETNMGAIAGKITVPTQNSPYSATPYYIESRKAIGFDSRLSDPQFSDNQSGIFINKIAYDYLPAPRLIDTTPTANDWYTDNKDASLTVGNTFSDPANGISITTISATSTGVTFSVAITTPTCVRSAPSTNNIQYNGSSVAAGTSLYVSLQTSNNDSYACGSSYIVADGQSLPSGYTLVPSSSYLQPEQSEYVYFIVGVPQDAVEGWKSINVDMMNTSSGLRKSVSLSFYVTPGPQITSVNPNVAEKGSTASVYGSNFSSSGNYVIFYTPNGSTAYLWPNYQSTSEINFTVPTQYYSNCGVSGCYQTLPYGSYDIQVETASGARSNFQTMIVAPNATTVITSAVAGTCNSGPNTARLVWTPTINPNVKGYQIFRDGVLYAEKIDGRGSYIWADSSVPFNTSHTYFLKEVYFDGTISNKTNTASISMGDFCPVVNVQVNFGTCEAGTSNVATLTWPRPQFGVTGYKVYRGGVLAGTFNGVVSQYPREVTIPNGLAGTSQSFTVRALYAGDKSINSIDLTFTGTGESADSNIASAVVPSCEVSPPAPAPAPAPAPTPVPASSSVPDESIYDTQPEIAVSEETAVSEEVAEEVAGEVVEEIVEEDVSEDGSDPDSTYD